MHFRACIINTPMLLELCNIFYNRFRYDSGIRSEVDVNDVDVNN